MSTLDYKLTANFVTVSSSFRTNVWLKIDYGDGSVQTIETEPSSVLKHKYANPGKFNVTAYAYNNISQVNLTCSNEIHVRNSINDLTIDVPDVVSLPEGKYVVAISSSKLFMGITCYFDVAGTEMTKSFPMIDVGTVKETQFDLSNLSAQTFEATVTCSDGTTNITTSTALMVVESISGLTMTLSRNITQVEDTVSIDLEVSSGSNITFVVSYGDGQLDLKYSGSETKRSFHVSYNTIGTFMVRGSAINALSSITESAIMYVNENLGEVSFSHFSKDLYSGRAFAGTGSKGKLNKYNLDRKLAISANVTTGTNLHYKWSFDNGESVFEAETTEPEILKKYYKPGNVTITCTVSNGVTDITDSMEVEMLQPVFLTHFTNDGPQKAQKNVTFSLVIKNSTPTTCVLINLQNSTLLYGEGICPEILQSHNFLVLNYDFVERPVSTHLSFTEFYQEEGSYSVRVTVFNWVSRSFAVSQVAITRAECKYPILELFGSGLDPEDPMATSAHKQVVVEASVKLNCQFSKLASFTWSLYLTSLKDGAIGIYNNELLNASLSRDTTKFQRSVKFHAHYFIPGNLYNVSLTVIMTEMPEIYRTISMYIYVKPRPLFTAFASGTQRVIGYNKPYVVDIASKSYDPDEVKASGSSESSKKKWRYIWSCYREGEPRPNPTVAPVIAIPTQLQNITLLIDKGGCFGTGPGKLDVPDTNGSLSLNTNYSPLNAVMVIEVVINTGIKTAIAQHRLQISPGDPPAINIRCMANCLAKVNPSDRYALLGRCETCESLGLALNYKWSLTYYNSSSKSYEEHSELASIAAETGVSSRSISIFESTLTQGSDFRITLKGTSAWSSPTYTLLEFSTTENPFGGTCSISPLEGEAMQTSFTVMCKDWINPETETAAGLVYRVYVQFGEETTSLLRTSANPEMDKLVLGPGEEASNYSVNVFVDVAHELGAITRTSLAITVRPLRLQSEDMNQFLESASTDLSNLISNGDVQKGWQWAAAIASTMNAAPETGKSGDLTTTTAAPITTTMSPSGDAGRAKLRDDLAAAVTSTPVDTLDDIQLSANTMKHVTKQKNEVSASNQLKSTEFMTSTANTLTKFADGDNGDRPSLVDTISSASAIMGCMTNVRSAASDAYKNTVNNAKQIIAEHNETYNGTTESILKTMSYLTTTTESPTTVAILTSTAAAVEAATGQVRTVTNSLVDVTAIVSESLLQSQVPGQAPVVIATDSLELTASRVLAEAANNSLAKVKNGGFKMPGLDTLMNDSSSGFMDQKMSACPDNLFNWDPSGDKLGTSVLSLTIGNGQGKDIKMVDTTEDFTIYLDIPPNLIPEKVKIQPRMNKRNSTWGTIHSIEIQDNCSAIYFVLSPENSTSVYDIQLGYKFKPTADEYNMTFSVPHDIEYESEEMDSDTFYEMRHSILLPAAKIYGAGIYYLLVSERLNISLEYELPEYEDATATRAPITTPGPENIEGFLFGESKNNQPWYEEIPDPDSVLLNVYYLQLVAPACRFWSVEDEAWKCDGCRVGTTSTFNKMTCLCNHLTSFGSDFFVPPNTIDFGSAFSDLGGKLADNYAVLLTICLMIGFYIAIGVWAHYKDKQDVKKWGVTPLEDNLENEKYLYMITVSTGMQAKSGTSSNIFFNLSGERDQTGVRKLTDGKRKHLSRGSQVRYVATSENILGRLQTLRLWHDNSGKGDDASWFLDRITVSDLQTGRTFAFLVNDWLAVDEGDGVVDREVSVASPQDLTAFSNLFTSNSKKNFTDGHLWVSVFVRPYQSTYTRLQRLSVVISVTFLTMVVNAMFYETEPPNSTKFELGIVTITTFQLWVNFTYFQKVSD